MDDGQVFKSDLNIEVAREGDMLQEGQDLKDVECDKNPGHRDFIPFKDLTLEHIPYEIRKRKMSDKIKKKGSQVVRLEVEKIKNGRLIKEAGSVCVCKSDHNYFIKTNNHVVKTNDEVKHCTVEFHYNDKDRFNVLSSRGVELMHTCPYRDITLFTFHPVPDFLHQLDWTCNETYIVILYKDNQKVTLGDYIPTVGTNRFPSEVLFYPPHDLNSSLIHRMFISLPGGSSSYIKSSLIICQPIPSNRQIELTSIDIHIDEDGGNSRVILGEVLKLVDEFVVKISESIFQDEVKKCRLLWNGEVIGRGTRLYLEQVKTSHYLKGIDLEMAMKIGRDKYWIIQKGSIVDKERSVIMCCIGHPHGGMKMITFGRLLSLSYERFDNQYRHITQPNSDCQCKEVMCVQYSCKTCQGSSGSELVVSRVAHPVDVAKRFLNSMRVYFIIVLLLTYYGIIPIKYPRI